MFLEKFYQTVTIHQFDRLGNVLASRFSGRIREVACREEYPFFSACADGASKFTNLLGANGTAVSFALECHFGGNQRANSQVALTIDAPITGSTRNFDVLHANVAQ